MRISDWSSDVCSSYLAAQLCGVLLQRKLLEGPLLWELAEVLVTASYLHRLGLTPAVAQADADEPAAVRVKELCQLPTDAAHKVYAQIVAQQLRITTSTTDSQFDNCPIGFDVSQIGRAHV